MHALSAFLKNLLRSRILMAAVGVLLAYCAFAYLAVDPLSRWLLPKIGERQLDSRLTVERVTLDPWRLVLTVDGLRLATRDGAPLAGFGRLVVDLEASGLLRWAWRLREIRLSEPQLVLDIAPDGTLNWAPLLARLDEEPQQDQEMARLLIDHVVIERGNLRYQARDRVTPFLAALQPLGLELDGLSTLPEDRGAYTLLARLPEQGGTLKWKGEIGLNPLLSTGVVEIADVGLAKLAGLIDPQQVPLQVSGGTAGARFGYRFAMEIDGERAYPQARLEQLVLTLQGVTAELLTASGAPAAIGLEQAQAELPAVAFSMRDGVQLQFQDMTLGVRQLALEQGDAALLGIEQINARGMGFDLAGHRFAVADVELQGGAVESRRDRDGRSNWLQLIDSMAAGHGMAEPATAAAAAAAPFTFTLEKVRLAQWRLRHHDAAFVHPLELRAGKIGLEFALDNRDGALRLQPFNATLAGIDVHSALYPQPVATLETLSLQEGAVDMAARTASFQGVVLSELRARVLRQADRSLNWQAVLETAQQADAQPADKDSAPADASSWKVNIARLALEKASVQVEDRATAAPVKLDVIGGTAELQQLTSDLSTPVPLKARIQVKQGGTLAIDGKLTPSPAQADLKIQLSRLALKPFSPYLNQVALLRLEGGTLDVRGKLAVKASRALDAEFRGGFGLRQLAVSEEATAQPFLAWQEVASDTLRFGLAQRRLQLDELRVVRPVGKVIIHEDGSMNATRLLRPQQDAPAAKGQAVPAEAGFAAAVERIRVDGASLEFADLTLRPNFGTRIEALSGVINGLSTDPATTAQVELDGQVDEFGSARIRGSLQPFQATEYTDLKLAFRNLDMQRLTPYSGKFAGRRIDAGRLSLDLEYKIRQRQLASENKFVINKLKLGERVESRDALDLPLDLAIAVLEDSDGVIDLDLPVSGSLDDPQFSYGKIVWKAIANVVSKIVTAPFRALGKLLGMDAEQLQQVAFEPGSAALAPEQQEKLKNLAELMRQRAALQLTIVPAYHKAADTAALQEQATRRDVLQEMGVKLRPDEQPGPLDLANAKVQSAIERLLAVRSGGERGSKLLDDVKDYFRKSRPEDVPKYAEMLGSLRLTSPVEDAALAALARERAGRMRDYLTDAGGLPVERIGLGEVAAAAGDGQSVECRMELGLPSAAAAAR